MFLRYRKIASGVAELSAHMVVRAAIARTSRRLLEDATEPAVGVFCASVLNVQQLLP